MKIDYGVTGAMRKRFVQAVSDIIREPAVYQGIPSSAYRVGQYLITYDGALEADRFDKALIMRLREIGYDAPETDEIIAACDDQPKYDEATSFILPRDILSDDKIKELKKFVDCRSELFRHALGCENTDIIVTADRIIFPWFQEQPSAALEAYGRFIIFLCNYINSIKNVASKRRTITNEKLAMRDVIIHIGFNGRAYKGDRKLLLKNLQGDSAYKEQRKPIAARILEYASMLKSA